VLNSIKLFIVNVVYIKLLNYQVAAIYINIIYRSKWRYYRCSILGDSIRNNNDKVRDAVL